MEEKNLRVWAAMALRGQEGDPRVGAQERASVALLALSLGCRGTALCRAHSVSVTHLRLTGPVGPRARGQWVSLRASPGCALTEGPMATHSLGWQWEGRSQW